MTKTTRNVLIFIVVAVVLIFCVYPRPMGYVKLETPGVQSRITLQGPWFSSENLDSSQGPATVRADLYHPKNIEIQGEKDGIHWRLTGSGPWGDLSKVEVRKNQTAILTPGPPLKIKAFVREDRGSVNVNYTVVGCRGEHYDAIVRNGKPILPGVKIVDRAGAVLSQGKFEFG
jgi:hypothetical protein